MRIIESFEGSANAGGPDRHSLPGSDKTPFLPNRRQWPMLPDLAMEEGYRVVPVYKPLLASEEQISPALINVLVKIHRDNISARRED